MKETHASNKTEKVRIENERKAEAARRLAQSIKDKAAAAGLKSSALVLSTKQNPSQAVNAAVRDGDRGRVVTIKEIWQLHLLNQLMNPSGPLIPPSPYFSSFQSDDPAMLALGFQPTEVFTPNRTTFISPATLVTQQVPETLGDRQLNYIRVTGKAFAQLTLRGDVGCNVWCDPFDLVQPIKYNRGDLTTPYHMGALYGNGGRYASLSSNNVSGGYTWSPGNDPRVIPTEYANVTGIPTTVAGSVQDAYKKVNIYPYEILYVTDTGNFAAEVCATNYVRWVTSARMMVSVSNPTAFSATAIRARTQGDTVHRYSERIENPKVGDYGLTTPFVKSNYAETCWHGSSWMVPTKYVNVTAATGASIDFTDSTTASAFWRPQGVANWNSLQKCLQAMVPVVEITQNADDANRSVTVSIEVIIESCLVPVTNTTPLSGVDHLTFPGRLPLWYTPNCYLASVTPVDCGVSNTFVPSLAPMAVQAMARTVAAVKSDVSSKPAIQSLAQEAVTKPANVLHRIKSVADDSHGALSSIAGLVTSGAGVASKIGGMVKNLFGKVPVVKEVVKLVEEAVPLIEMAAAAA